MFQHLLIRGFALGVLFVMTSCGRSEPTAIDIGQEPMEYITWQTDGERAPDYPLPRLDHPFPPISVKPWGGTISHHLLTAPLIDRWFAELAARRAISTFYILSPSHGDRTAQTWAIAKGRWKVKGGWVSTDEVGSADLAQRLGVQLEPGPFQYEHGVHVFMPYIFQYFPHAKVVAVVYPGEPPVNMPRAEAFRDAVLASFDQKRDENFLLISTDYSHHGTEAQTLVKDARAELFWEHPGPALWNLVGCDNRPGIFVLASAFGPSSRSSVLWHTDAFRLSGKDPTDVTSYFFTWVW